MQSGVNIFCSHTASCRLSIPVQWLRVQLNFDGLNPFGAMKICSRQRQFEPRRVTISAIPGGIMEIIVGYLFGVLYYKCMLVYSLESPHQGNSNECTQHTFAR